VKRVVVVGVAEHGNSAVLVTLARGCVIDRRTIDLTRNLPTHPYHHEGSWAIGRYAGSPWAKKISLAKAIALVEERVHEAAARGARASLEDLENTIPARITSIAIRVCPKLPATIKERIIDTRAANVADSVMYRQALAAAAKERGWSVHWYDKNQVLVGRDATVAARSDDPSARRGERSTSSRRRRRSPCCVAIGCSRARSRGPLG
jgi:hypothetical protein